MARTKNISAQKFCRLMNSPLVSSFENPSMNFPNSVACIGIADAIEGISIAEKPTLESLPTAAYTTKKRHEV